MVHKAEMLYYEKKVSTVIVSIPPISTKQTIISHVKHQGPGLGQT